MDNPWKTLHRQSVYDNAWIHVREDEVINPSGGKGIYGVVEFKNQAIGIVPLDEDGNTWLVGQYRYPLDEYSWEIPMGGVPVGQDPVAGAKRELREETGLDAQSWHELMRLHPSNSVTDECGIVYVARDLTAGEPRFDDTEDLQIERLPFDEALARAMDGRITDASSVAALLKLALTRATYGL